MSLLSSALFFAILLVPTIAAPVARDSSSSPYAPTSAACPSTPLVRSATGISSLESNYFNTRLAKASVSLASWVSSTDPGFATAKLPVVALTTSGGGYRSLLTGAGVISALDNREASQTALSGLFQALTYQAGLSGGSWLLSSLAANNYPTVSSLRDNLWGPAFQRGLIDPGSGLISYAEAIDDIIGDIEAKKTAGFPPTLTDPWGRLLSYQLLQAGDGGVGDTLSGVTKVSNFVSYNVPYPIITALGANPQQCPPPPNAIQYEFHPYEMGSW